MAVAFPSREAQGDRVGVGTRMPMGPGLGTTLPALCGCTSGVDPKLPPEDPRTDGRGLRLRNDAEEARSSIQAGSA